MKIIFTIFVLSVAGCATSGTWLNNSKTPEQAQVDNYECRRDGEQYAENLGFGGNPLIVADRARECLRVRGYAWTQTNPR
jgi:hypothetical protein